MKFKKKYKQLKKTLPTLHSVIDSYVADDIKLSDLHQRLSHNDNAAVLCSQLTQIAGVVKHTEGLEPVARLLTEASMLLYDAASTVEEIVCKHAQRP